MTAPNNLQPIPENTVVWFTTAVHKLHEMLTHIDIENKEFGLSKNALFKLLPPKKTCESWTENDVETWCNYTYEYLKRARCEVAVAAYLAQLWNLDTHHKQRIIKFVATRFKTGLMTYKLGLEQVPWTIK